MDTIDSADYTVIGGEPFVDWPRQSPTSCMGINLRFYSIVEEEGLGARYRIDIGPSTEAALESMYTDFDLATKNISHIQFEETTRAFMQQRLAFVSAYALSTALYVLFTTDSGEAKRLTTRELRVMRSQERRMPYMTYPVYQHPATSLRDAVKRLIGTLRAVLFH